MFVPPMLIPVNASVPAKVPLLLFVMVIGCGAPAVPTSCGAKFTLVVNEIVGCVAVPESDTVAGVPPGIFSVPDRAPAAADSAGANVTDTWHCAPALSTGGHAFCCANSVDPAMAIPEGPAVPDPLFVIVTL